RYCFSIYSSLFITSCKARGLLTTCGGQIDAFGFPTGRTDHQDQALRLQAPQTVTDIALGTGQRRHQLRVTTRDHPPGPLLIGCQPPQHLPLESGETHGRHYCSPARSVRLCVSPGTATIGSAPTCAPAWPGRAGWRRWQLCWWRPVHTPCTTTWTAGSAKSVRWMIHGASGTTWRDGKLPWAMHRLITVALTPNCWAACVSV